MFNIVNIIGVDRVQGKVISFSEQDNSGVVIADDGIQYSFNGSNWIEQYLPKAGDNIDFNFDSDTGAINRISYQSNQSYASAPPPIPSHLSDAGEHYVIPSLQKNQDRYAPPSQSFNQDFDNQYDSNLDVLYAQEENYNIVDWTKKVIVSNYANFSGRARRKEYWLFYLGYIILTVIAVIIDVILGTADYGLFQSILSLVLFIPGMAATVRRFHDIGRSGWNFLWLFLPIIGAILVIIWLAKDTSSETNQWGPPARRV